MREQHFWPDNGGSDLLDVEMRQQNVTSCVGTVGTVVGTTGFCVGTVGTVKLKKNIYMTLIL